MLAERSKLQVTPLPNPVDIGKQLESIVRRFFTTHLPGRFAVTSGYLLNSYGNVSKQQDVIIHDTLEASNLAATDEYAVLPIEAVYATIEIKTTLSKQSMTEGLANAASVKNLHGTALLVHRETGEVEEVKEYGAKVYTALFAFDADTTLITASDNLLTSEATFDHICILGKGNIFWTTQGKPVEEDYYSLSTGPREVGKREHIAIIEPKSIENSGAPLFFSYQRYVIT